jgi:serine/threonine-protein kinase HipA
MARRRKSGRLNVFLNSRLVGTLNREASGAIDFRYADAWLAWDYRLPVSLSLPLREDRYIGDPVLAVFDNLIPDNVQIRRTVAERVGAEGTDAFSMLAALGRDCVGALQFLHDGQEPGAAGIIEAKSLSEKDIADLLANLARNPLGMDSDDDFRISIAGAQEKTALLRHRGRWCKPVGTTPTTHIFKPQIGELPNGIDLSNSVENEYLCLELARAFGLPTAKAEMASFGKKRVLIVERFDRLVAEDKRILRLPQEDMCQALSIPWTQKYESEGGPGVQPILKLLAGSDDPQSDRSNFLKAIIVFWLLAATDGHGKNFSVFLEPGGGFRMTPLYDIVSAQPSFDAGQIQRKKLKLAMAVGDNKHYAVEGITTRHFVQSAERAGMGREIALAVIDDIIQHGPAMTARVHNNLPAGFPQQIAQSITTGVLARIEQLESGRGKLNG